MGSFTTTMYAGNTRNLSRVEIVNDSTGTSTIDFFRFIPVFCTSNSSMVGLETKSFSVNSTQQQIDMPVFPMTTDDLIFVSLRCFE